MNIMGLSQIESGGNGVEPLTTHRELLTSNNATTHTTLTADKNVF